MGVRLVARETGKDAGLPGGPVGHQDLARALLDDEGDATRDTIRKSDVKGSRGLGKRSRTTLLFRVQAHSHLSRQATR